MKERRKRRRSKTRFGLTDKDKANYRGDKVQESLDRLFGPSGIKPIKYKPA